MSAPQARPIEPAPLTLVPMPGPFGAVVEGLDVSRALGPGTVVALHAALHEHRVLTITDQRLDEASYARFGRYWGDPIEFFNPRDRHRLHPELILITNTESTPAPMRNGAMHWHHDSTYEAVPAAVTMLHAVEAPTGDANETRFVDMVAAYEALPESTKGHIERLRVLHDPRGGHPDLMFDGERRGESGGRLAGVTICSHPLVARHPASGRPALYGISGTAVGIEGTDDVASVELLLDLKRHATAARFEQRVSARAGSVLIWDNLSVMHRATAHPYSDIPGERRLLYRISTRAKPSAGLSWPLHRPAG